MESHDVYFSLAFRAVFSFSPLKSTGGGCLFLTHENIGSVTEMSQERNYGIKQDILSQIPNLPFFVRGLITQSTNMFIWIQKECTGGILGKVTVLENSTYTILTGYQQQLKMKIILLLPLYMCERATTVSDALHQRIVNNLYLPMRELLLLYQEGWALKDASC